MKQQGYDIIGDIHGHAEKLINLLDFLGYRKSDTGYCHPDRKVIFVGDFIDRGEHLRQHRQLLDVVMAMVDNNHALAVMGNHEFNALAFHTFHDGDYLRPRTEKNVRLHQAFLNEFEYDEEKKQEILDFFYRLPLFLDLQELRVLHACWDDHYIEYIKERTLGNKLTPELLIEASTKGTLMHQAIEQLLKGLEVDLPEELEITGKSGKRRNSMRVQWWNRTATSLAEVVLPMDLDLKNADQYPVPENIPHYHELNPPCFIGHYWMSGKPRPLVDNIACLDYSAATDGKLVAYRWSGERVLSKDNFAYAI